MEIPGPGQAIVMRPQCVLQAAGYHYFHGVPAWFYLVRDIQCIGRYIDDTSVLSIYLYGRPGTFPVAELYAIAVTVVSGN